MEDQADIVENSAVILIKQHRTLHGLHNRLQQERRLVGAEVTEEDQTLTALVLESPAFSLTGTDRNSTWGRP